VPPAVILRIYFFISYAAFGVYLPFFPAWLEAQGFAGPRMGALVSLVPLFSLLSPLIVGLLADGMGLRGRLITICSCLMAGGMTLLALGAGLVSPLPFSLVALSMVIFSVFRAPSSGLGDVLAMESHSNYGRLRLFGSVGFLCAAFAAGRFIDVTQPLVVPALLAVGLWCGALMSLWLPKTTHLPPRPALKDAQELLRQPGFRWLSGAVLLTFMSHSSYDLCSSLRLRDIGASSGFIGAFWALGTLSEVVVMYYAMPFILRVGPGKTLTVACLAAAARWTFLKQATSLSLIMTMQPLHAITFGLMWLSVVAVLKREVGDKGMATGQGLLATAGALGTMVGLWTWGLLYAERGADHVFLVASGVAALAALFSAPLIRFSSAKA
jgi:MFS transporter, PPP family, 3-phenylpropionic acid transporter